jgi:Spy/CpxP family protein refolding chaperone
MSRWTMFASAAALSVVGLAVGGSVSGAGPGGGHGYGGFGHHRRGGILEDARLLDLSDEQQAAAHDLFRQHGESVRPLMDKERDLHRQLRQAASAADADPAAVGRIAIQAYRTGEDIHAQRKQLEDSFVGLLTPEQKEMWTKLRASREKERERHREGWGAGRGKGRQEKDAPGDDVR